MPLTVGVVHHLDWRVPLPGQHLGNMGSRERLHGAQAGRTEEMLSRDMDMEHNRGSAQGR